MIEMIGGPDRDRTDDLFHAISATSRNLLKLHDTNRAVTLPNAQIFPVIGPLMDPRDDPRGVSLPYSPCDLCTCTAEVHDRNRRFVAIEGVLKGVLKRFIARFL